MKYQGSCHCGHVAFEVEGEIDGLLACNCSICQRKGSLLWFLPRERMTLLTPEANAQTYTFHRHAIAHRFCPRCGIHPYAEGKDGEGNVVAAINARCLENVALDSMPVKHFDGRAI
jgi:hypothetical protein